jgi:hypothetical protein
VAGELITKPPKSNRSEAMDFRLIDEQKMQTYIPQHATFGGIPKKDGGLKEKSGSPEKTIPPPTGMRKKD